MALSKLRMTDYQIVLKPVYRDEDVVILVVICSVLHLTE